MNINLDWIKKDWMYIIVLILCLAAILQLTIQNAELQHSCNEQWDKNNELYNIEPTIPIINITVGEINVESKSGS